MAPLESFSMKTKADDYPGGNFKRHSFYLCFTFKVDIFKNTMVSVLFIIRKNSALSRSSRREELQQSRNFRKPNEPVPRSDSIGGGQFFCFHR
ncbi:MAG: hypothetical protein EA344_02370 [Alkalicoccus sp.]|nr:MAG: hypothetical protein EA344_02370 [Alkalicoccus sp.]